MGVWWELEAKMDCIILDHSSTLKDLESLRFPGMVSMEELENSTQQE